MYLTLCHPFDIRNLSAEQLQYEDHTFTRVQRLHQTHLEQASGTREGKFGDLNLLSLRRTLQSAMVADISTVPH